tara:strand:+ start:380 stop:739 length:360 start_codon:yes stop_codon:yes gene_type:complete
MALPWWIRGGLTSGAALLKKHLKGKGKEVVGEARKKLIAKLAKMKEAKKKKAGEKEYLKGLKNLTKKFEKATQDLREKGEQVAQKRKDLAGMTTKDTSVGPTVLPGLIKSGSEKKEDKK